MAAETTEIQGQETQAALEEVDLLDSIISVSKMVRDESQSSWAKEIISEFAREVMKGEMTMDKDTEVMINQRIATIDQIITNQLNKIMHNEAFQKLEASWRGLHYLVQQTESGERLKVKVFNCEKKDLAKDMEKALDFDQSALFKKIYEDEYGMFGGHAYGMLLGDYEFGFNPHDMNLLEKLSGVAAAAHAPFISAASPKMFNWEHFTELGGPRDLSKIFTAAEYMKWKSFRESEDSRYVGLTLPHILMRLPYGDETIPVEDFSFEEDVDGTDHSKYLWGNAAYALGTRMTEAFADYGWCAAIRGVEGGGAG